MRRPSFRRAKFEPVGLSFVGGSLVSPGAMEGFEHGFKKPNPLRPLYVAYRPGAAKPDWTYNMPLRHGVRSSLEYAKVVRPRPGESAPNPDLAPHLEFVDMGGHGYATVRLTGTEMRTEFVCIPRPITRSERPDGGPLRYRVVHSAKLWEAGETSTSGAASDRRRRRPFDLTFSRAASAGSSCSARGPCSCSCDAMIQIVPIITRKTISTPNASASTLLVLSGPLVMWRKKTR